MREQKKDENVKKFIGILKGKLPAKKTTRRMIKKRRLMRKN